MPPGLQMDARRLHRQELPRDAFIHPPQQPLCLALIEDLYVFIPAHVGYALYVCGREVGDLVVLFLLLEGTVQHIAVVPERRDAQHSRNVVTEMVREQPEMVPGVAQQLLIVLHLGAHLAGGALPPAQPPHDAVFLHPGFPFRHRKDGPHTGRQLLVVPPALNGLQHPLLRRHSGIYSTPNRPGSLLGATRGSWHPTAAGTAATLGP
mmetsp:Transcript_28836/g.74030  ORF Transcript_28836/g.74030 Transcript_28836/m.74030 type:complete len:207 (+) Transcript_28836:1248-1868(+)